MFCGRCALDDGCLRALVCDTALRQATHLAPSKRDRRYLTTYTPICGMTYIRSISERWYLSGPYQAAALRQGLPGAHGDRQRVPNAGMISAVSLCHLLCLPGFANHPDEDMLRADLVDVLAAKAPLLLRSLWYCRTPRACINLRTFEEAAERSRGPLDASQRGGDSEPCHMNGRNADGCDGEIRAGKRRIS